MAYAESKQALAAQLAPLAPDAFLAWVWSGLPEATRGAEPLTIDDIWWATPPHPEFTVDMLRRGYVGLAARVRRNQRLGLDPWFGIDGQWTGWRR